MTGSDAVGWSQPGLQKRLLSAVKRSGAVSPATRASERRSPVVMPREAAGMTTRTIVTQRGAPSASADGRRERGEEAPRERGGALPGDVAEEEDEHAERRERRARGRSEHEPLHAAAMPVGRVHGRWAPGVVRTLAIRSRASAFTASVIANSTSPISTTPPR